MFLTKFEYDVARSLFEIIIPTDKDPGANEASAVEFLDNLLTDPSSYWKISKWQKHWRLGIKLLEKITLQKYNMSFTSLSFSQRTKIVSMLSEGILDGWNNNSHNLEQAEFFEMVRIHAIQGFLSDPRYGGNKNKIGWKFIGYTG